MRKPRFVGSGIYMMLQPFGKPLVKGDTCWDADLGELEWDGKEWKQHERFVHPELQEGEVFLINMKPGEQWSIPSFCDSIRAGLTAFTTNGERIVQGYFPLFGKLKEHEKAKKVERKAKLELSRASRHHLSKKHR